MIYKVKLREYRELLGKVETVSAFESESISEARAVWRKWYLELHGSQSITCNSSAIIDESVMK